MNDVYVQGFVDRCASLGFSEDETEKLAAVAFGRMGASAGKGVVRAARKLSGFLSRSGRAADKGTDAVRKVVTAPVNAARNVAKTTGDAIRNAGGAVGDVASAIPGTIRRGAEGIVSAPSRIARHLGEQISAPTKELAESMVSRSAGRAARATAKRIPNLQAKAVGKQIVEPMRISLDSAARKGTRQTKLTREAILKELAKSDKARTLSDAELSRLVQENAASVGQNVDTTRRVLSRQISNEGGRVLGAFNDASNVARANWDKQRTANMLLGGGLAANTGIGAALLAGQSSGRSDQRSKSAEVSDGYLNGDVNMNDAYVQGFVEKCAEMCVDPNELIKSAIPGVGMLGRLGRVGGTARTVWARGQNLADRAGKAVKSNLGYFGKRLSEDIARHPVAAGSVLVGGSALTAGAAGKGLYKILNERKNKSAVQSAAIK